MRDKVLAILELYLEDELDIDALEERVIALAWSDDPVDFDPIDEVAVELSYLKDKVSDEDTFRQNLSNISARYRTEARPMAI